MAVMIKKSALLIVLAALIILIPPIVQAGDPVCAKCGRVITQGNYITAEGRYFHPEHFVCAKCGRAIGDQRYYPRDGKIYDKSCYTDLFVEKCAYCGKPIEGEYIIQNNQKYHKGCFASSVAEKCAWCGQPIVDSSTTYEGKAYHNACYRDHIALYCVLCGGIIDGKYFTTFRGGAWHDFHKGQVPECDFCTAFINVRKQGTFLKLDDGRYLCDACMATAITTDELLTPLAQEVAGALEAIGIKVDLNGLEFHLEGQDVMSGLGDRLGTHRRGFTDFKEYKALFGLIRDRHLNVYVLNGLTAMECTEVLAHELTHVWLFSKGRTKTSPELCEGSCNYAAWLVLSRYRGLECDYIKKNVSEDSDPVYGEGFRKVKAWAEKIAQPAWLEYISKHDENPW
jgi:hypothetical protein